MKFFFMFLLLTLTPNSFADDILVAVASNFKAPMEKISAQFSEKTGHKLLISFGATGKFYTQIKNDAPFDVLLSADQEHPAKLVQYNLALKETQFTYGIGKLVLWCPDSKIVDSKGEVLLKGSYKHLAIANPKLAPYGVAAQETLSKLGLWEKGQSRLVFGENITQTHQFVASGNANLGFVAYSQLIIPKQAIKGSFWLVPQEMYSPLKQDAILLTKAKNKIAAKEFLAFLKSESAKTIIKEYGYGEHTL